MPIGTCRLCLDDNVELRDSHFIPRAFYKLMREEDPDKAEPVLASAEKIMFSSKQAHDYLLCDVCEGLFNKNGEKWVLEHWWQSPTDFPLRDLLITLGPAGSSENDFVVFETAGVAGVDRSKLVGFAVSVF